MNQHNQNIAAGVDHPSQHHDTLTAIADGMHPQERIKARKTAVEMVLLFMPQQCVSAPSVQQARCQLAPAGSEITEYSRGKLGETTLMRDHPDARPP